MVIYSLVALTLKLFSFNNLTKKTYRKIGNIFGEKKRKKANINTYITRGNLLLNLCKKYHAIKENDKLLEIGTGWIHWYSIYLRLFYNVKITMIDVWDNRQIVALQTAFFKLSKISKKLAKQKYFRDIKSERRRSSSIL